ncbi:MAG: Crp/Fnr family transcriptional regulator [Bacteroidetes bacterium]|nr:Crp/Fnr family transcriptional regulator [Bacteroidota bacterium]MBK9672728.1 Crp/Fnr family transcriptional regulator [Bacteroidota bacterium]
MPTNLKYWYLHDHQLFKNLSFGEIDALCILKRFKKSKKNELLDLPNSEKERIYFLKQGTIKLIKINEEGDEILIDLLQKGDLFGDLNLESPEANEEFFKVVSDEAIICTFYRDKLEEVMVKKPDFALNYIKFIGFNFKKIQNSYKNILFKDAKTRLMLLLNMILEKENINTNSFVLPNYLTQKDIAQLICTTRQTIITLFKELENEGILMYAQKEISIPDIQKIKNFVRNVK